MARESEQKLKELMNATTVFYNEIFMRGIDKNVKTSNPFKLISCTLSSISITITYLKLLKRKFANISICLLT